MADSASPTLSASPPASPCPGSPFRATDEGLSADSVAREVAHTLRLLPETHQQAMLDASRFLREHAATLAVSGPRSSALFPMEEARSPSIEAEAAELDALNAPHGRQAVPSDDLAPAASSAAAARLEAAAEAHLETVQDSLCYLLTGGAAIPSPGEMLLRAAQCRRQVSPCASRLAPRAHTPLRPTLCAPSPLRPANLPPAPVALRPAPHALHPAPVALRLSPRAPRPASCSSRSHVSRPAPCAPHNATPLQAAIDLFDAAADRRKAAHHHELAARLEKKANARLLTRAMQHPA